MKDNKHGKNNSDDFANADGRPQNGGSRGKAAEAEKKTSAGGRARKEISGDDLKYGSAGRAAKGGILGIFIGLAVIIPGVSGSAIAIMLKLYEKLMYAIGNIFKDFKRCFIFLLPIGLGAAIGFVAGFFGVKTLMDAMLFAVVALFAGLMLGAYPSVLDEVRGEKHSLFRILLFIFGLAVPVALSFASVYFGDGEADLTATEPYKYLIYVALGFAVAITQLVPGLSATALLMTTGHYIPIMQSVSVEYWSAHPEIFAIYACLIAGFVAGLLCCAKLLGTLLKRWRTATFHLVAGLALGSIVTMFFNRELYAEYQNWANGERFGPELVFAAILFAIGLVIAYMFVRIQRKKNMPLKK